MLLFRPSLEKRSTFTFVSCDFLLISAFPSSSKATDQSCFVLCADGYLGDTFNFELTLSSTGAPAPTPAPDTPVDPEIGCLMASPLSLPSNIAASTVGAQAYFGVSCGFAFVYDSAGLWYSVTGTGNMITASTCSFAGFETMISVWTGSCSSLTCIDGNDDDCSLRSQVTWTSNSLQTYYIYVCKCRS